MSELETPSVRIKALERENIALKALATGSEENAILRRQGFGEWIYRCQGSVLLDSVYLRGERCVRVPYR